MTLALWSNREFLESASDGPFEVGQASPLLKHDKMDQYRQSQPRLVGTIFLKITTREVAYANVTPQNGRHLLVWLAMTFSKYSAPVQSSAKHALMWLEARRARQK